MFGAVVEVFIGVGSLLAIGFKLIAVGGGHNIYRRNANDSKNYKELNLWDTFLDNEHRKILGHNVKALNFMLIGIDFRLNIWGDSNEGI